MDDGFAPTVRAAQTGDPAAYGRLVEACWSDLVRLARSVIGDLEAEDVVQEALVVGWRKLGQLREPDRFRSWITRIVFRRCLWHNRWNRLRAALGDRGTLAPESAPTHERELVAGLLAAQLLEHLPPRQRAVLHLTVVEGLSDAQIGAALGLAPGSVRAHRRRARARLNRLR